MQNNFYASEKLTCSDVTSNPVLAKALEEGYSPDPCKIYLFVAVLAKGPYRNVPRTTSEKEIKWHVINLAREYRSFVANINWWDYEFTTRDRALDDKGTRLSEISLSGILKKDSDVIGLSIWKPS